MGLSAAEISAAVEEIAPAVTGGSVQKIFQPTPDAITLEVRRSGQTVSLLLSADPETARLHLLSHRPPNPASPPLFCQFLRANLEGARLEGLEQVQDDRLVRLRFKTRDTAYILIAELTGRSADLFLLDEEEKILATLKTLREQAGRPYHPPPPPPSRSQERRTSGWELSPDHPFPVSASLERRYQQEEEDRARARTVQARTAEIRKALKKTHRRLDALQGDLDKAARYREYARYGELLKAHLGEIAKGQERITVVDYFDPALPEIVLPLDPAKGARGNMEDHFRKHRKYLGAEREIRPRLEAAERELTALRAELAKIERGEFEPSPSPLPHDPLHQGKQWVPQGKGSLRKKATVKGPFRRFVSADGLQIFVGRNARENEELTFKFARSHDLWFHAQGTPGSHVVLWLEKGMAPPPESIRDAATLTLLYSDLKKSGKGDVIYTKRSNVRKVKSRTPGTVTVTQEKSLFLELDQTRLRRLKQAAHSPPSQG
jgi:predicted ribosome quality control (RQC) complex YloA/Tae2 family protein